MDSAPLVSVIMPTYNRATLIGESLDSLVSQTYENWECIIVDDGSTDQTKQVVNAYIVRDSRFHYFKKQNEGTAIARNYAVSRSQGTYILPLDSDDLIGDTYMEKAVKIFSQNDNLSLVYSKAKKFGVETGEWHLPEFQFDKFLIYNMIFNSTLFKRKDFDAVGGYMPKNRLEDWDLWIKILKLGGEIYQIPETLYYYRTHERHSITTDLAENNLLYKKSMDELFKNHVDVFLDHIGNPIELERERRELSGIARTADYQLVLRIINSKTFKFLRSLRNRMKF